MKHLGTRLADLCRRRAADDRFLRRFRMMRDEAADDDSGPGWYESSRDLALGLSVRDSAVDASLLAEFLAAQHQRPSPRLASAQSGA